MTEEVKSFQLGDCVVLKSGGPKMTVIAVGEHHHEKEVVECQWFDGTKIKQHFFLPESLKLQD